MELLGTGLSGLVGSRIVEILSPRYSFTDLSRKTGVDITDEQSLCRHIYISPAPWLLHFAAYTDVQGAEQERMSGRESLAWKVNVEATKTIVGICRKTGKYLIYLSTDYVFDGKKNSYTERDIPNPLGWYGVTKCEGEKLVAALGKQASIIRISTPYRSRPAGKKDFVHKIIETLESGQRVTAPHDQFFSPTFIDDIACSIDAIVMQAKQNVYHVVARSALTPFDAALHIARTYHLNSKNVVPISFEAYCAKRAPIPKQAILKHATIETLGVILHSFEEGIDSVKQQEAG